MRRSPAAFSPANTSAASRCRRTRGSPTAATTPRDVINERNWTMVRSCATVAARTGHSMLDIAFGWLLAKPVIASVIAGAMHAGAGRAERARRQRQALGRRRRRARPRSRDRRIGWRSSAPSSSAVRSAGLFAANMLRSIGWDATVFERNPDELTGRGAGISTHPQLHA